MMKNWPSFAGKHWCESEEDSHGDGESLGDAVGGQEQGQPGDGEEDGGDHVGLYEVVLQLPSQDQLQNEAGIVDVVVLSVVRILVGSLIATSIKIFNQKNI